MLPIRSVAILLLGLGVSALSVLADPLERSISSSRQFVVYGQDIGLRGAICDLAERTKRDVLQTIDQRDDWVTPIIISTRPVRANLPELPRSALHFAQTGFGLKIQLDLTIDFDTSQCDVRRELLGAVLLEMIYRERLNLPGGSRYLSPPHWLVAGITPWQSDLDKQQLIDLLRGAISNQNPSLAELLQPPPSPDLDSPSQLLLQAYFFELVEFLIRLPSGKKRLGQFISNLSFASDHPLVDLGLHFPELSDPAAAERSWKAHIEEVRQSQPEEPLTIEATEKELDKMLTLTIQGSSAQVSYRFEEFPQFLRMPCAPSILAQLSGRLTLLESRAHPICRPIIHEYATIGSALARRKTVGVRRRLARLETSRKELRARDRQIADYVNWFEVTNSRIRSQAFTDYLKTAERLSEPGEKRHDPLSVYLDFIETQFESEQWRDGVSNLSKMQ